MKCNIKGTFIKALEVNQILTTLEMMKINVDEQRNLIGNLIERAERHVNKYL